MQGKSSNFPNLNGKKPRRKKATIHYPDMEKIAAVVYQGKKNSCRSPGKEKANKEKVGKEKAVDHPNSKVWLNFTLHEPNF